MIILVRNWRSLLFRGILALVAGMLALGFPGITLGALALLFGAYALVDGIFGLIAGIRSRGGAQPSGLLIAIGILGIAVGVMTFLWPIVTVMALLAFVATLSILRGVFDIVAAIRLRRVITGEWLLGILGVVSIAFGALIILSPAAGIVAVGTLIGIYLLFYGATMVALALKLRKLDKFGLDQSGVIKIFAADERRIA
jgi:uncharacterized membrane protein HdeD (DUF308 family)